MKINRKTSLAISVLIIVGIWGFVALKKGNLIFADFIPLIFILIIIGPIAFFRARKIDKEVKEGLPSADEMSTQIKYKSGYYAFNSSLIMWGYIFLLKDRFPDIDSILVVGMFLSVLIAIVTKIIVKRNFNEKSN